MFLGETGAAASTEAREAPPTTPTTSRSVAARREAVREQLEAGLGEERGAAGREMRHPQGLHRRSLSLGSVSPGFLRADMRDIPAIPSEEELAMMPTATQDADEQDAASERSVEELFRRVSSRGAQDAVDGFLQQLGSQEGGEAMMLINHDQSSVSDVDPESDAEPMIDVGPMVDVDPTSDTEHLYDVDDGASPVTGQPRGQEHSPSDDDV